MTRTWLQLSALLLISRTALGQPGPAAPAAAAPAPAPAAAPAPDLPAAPSPAPAAPAPAAAAATEATPRTPGVVPEEEPSAVAPGPPAPPAPPLLVTAPPGPPAPATPRDGFGVRPSAGEPPEDTGGDTEGEPAPPLSASRLQLEGTLETQWLTDPSFDLFSEEDGAGFGGVSAGFAVVSTDTFAVVPQAGWAHLVATRSGLFGGQTDTELDVHRLHLGATVRYALTTVFEPHARVAAGLDLSSIAMDETGTPGLSQDEVSPFVSAGAGFTVHTVPGGLVKRGALRSLLLGVSVEGGYTLTPGIDVNPVPESSPRVATGDASFGTLSRSGPYVRLGLQLRL